MTEKESRARIREIEKALKAFPSEVKRQERALREIQKIQKAFGKMKWKPKKVRAL